MTVVNTYYFDGSGGVSNEWTEWKLPTSLNSFWNEGWSNASNAFLKDGSFATESNSGSASWAVLNDDPAEGGGASFTPSSTLTEITRTDSDPYSTFTSTANLKENLIAAVTADTMIALDGYDFSEVPDTATVHTIEIRIRHFQDDGVLHLDCIEARLNYSVDGISDPDNVWSDPSNAFDGDSGTFAQISTTGSDTSNYLEGIGTTAPESGADITQVRARVITEFQTGTWRTFTEPTGGWDWDIISSLKTRAWYETGEIDIIVAYIYDGDTQLAPETFDPIAAGNINPKLATIELEVTSEETVGDTHQQDVSDSLEVVDEASRVITKHLIDTVEASDDFSRTLQAERTFDDSVEITDELDAEQIGAITEDITTGGGLMLGGISLGSLSPAQTFFETLQIQEEWENDHADFLAVHDDLFQRLIKGVNDSIEIDDDIGRTAGFERAFDDEVEVSDILGKNMAKSASDGLSLDDTLAKQVEKAHSDSIELEDTVSKAVERVLSDQVDIVDDFTKFTGYLRKLEDTVEVSDELHATTEVTHRVGNADILAVTDEVSRKIIKHIDDSVVISDTINARIIWISDPARPRSVYAISPKGDKQTFAPGTDPASGNFSPSPRREVTDWTVSDDPSQGNWNGA